MARHKNRASSEQKTADKKALKNIAEKERIAFIYIATGKRGVGKTYTTTNSVILPYTKDNKKTGWKGRPVVIFDTNKEFTQFPPIWFDIEATKPDPEDPRGRRRIPDTKQMCKALIDFSNKVQKGEAKPQVIRVLPQSLSGEPMSPNQKKLASMSILKEFKNGLILLEDLNHYMLGARTTDMVGAIVTNRHRNQDIIIHLQATSKLDPTMFQNVNILRMHYQSDNLGRIKSKITEPNLFFIAFAIIKNEYMAGNKRYYLYVNPEDEYIYGPTEEQFRKGVETFAVENPKELTKFEKSLKYKDDLLPSKDAVMQSFIDDKMHFLATYSPRAKK